MMTRIMMTGRDEPECVEHAVAQPRGDVEFEPKVPVDNARGESEYGTHGRVVGCTDVSYFQFAHRMLFHCANRFLF